MGGFIVIECYLEIVLKGLVTMKNDGEHVQVDSREVRREYC